MLKKLFEKKKEEGTFVEHKMKTRFEQRKTVIFMLTIIAIIGWVYIFFGSTIFTVQTLDIQGTEILERGEVAVLVNELLEDQRHWPLREKNIFFINNDLIISGLKETLFVENVIVDKIYPNILRLKIEERQSSLYIFVEHSLYEIDRHGIVTDEFSDAEEEEILERTNDPRATRDTNAPILKIRQVSNIPIQGQEFASEFRTETWLDTFKVLGDLGFGYRNAVLDYTTSSKLILDMFEPYDVYLDILEPLEPQINGFYTFLRVRDTNVPIYEYIDARVPGKVFFK